MRKRTSQSGNSAMEYALPLGLLFIASTIVLSLSGSTEQIATFFKTSVNAEEGSGKLVVQKLGHGVVPILGTLSIDANGNLCFGDNACLPAIHITGGRVETAGGIGNGEVSRMATIIRSLANELEAIDADPSLVGLIERLANNGHGIANNMGQLATCAGTDNCYVHHDDIGQNYFNNVRASQNAFNRSKTELDNFFSENPTLAGVYEQAVNIIDFETDEINTIVSGINYTPGSHHDDSQVSNAAKIVHQDSNVICAQANKGNGGDNCTQGG